MAVRGANVAYWNNNGLNGTFAPLIADGCTGGVVFCLVNHEVGNPFPAVVAVNNSDSVSKRDAADSGTASWQKQGNKAVRNFGGESQLYHIVPSGGQHRVFLKIDVHAGRIMLDFRGNEITDQWFYLHIFIPVKAAREGGYRIPVEAPECRYSTFYSRKYQKTAVCHSDNRDIYSGVFSQNVWWEDRKCGMKNFNSIAEK